MRKIVLTFGLISGALASLMLAATVPFADRIGFGRETEIFGYTTIVLSLLLVFFGVRSYRDNVGNGRITLGRAFGIGMAITAISCLCYVVTWEIVYFNFLHDFMDKYGSYMIQQAKASGASDAALQAKALEMKHYKELYENPLFNAMMTFMEPFPVGLVISLISAAALRKRKETEPDRARALHHEPGF